MEIPNFITVNVKIRYILQYKFNASSLNYSNKRIGVRLFIPRGDHLPCNETRNKRPPRLPYSNMCALLIPSFRNLREFGSGVDTRDQNYTSVFSYVEKKIQFERSWWRGRNSGGVVTHGHAATYYQRFGDGDHDRTSAGQRRKGVAGYV